MKKFDEGYVQIGHDMPSTELARMLASSGFGIVPGTGGWRNGRPITRKRGTLGGHSRPLFGMQVMTDWLTNPNVVTQCPYYVALGPFGDDNKMLTVIDIDNGHGENEAVDFNVLWESVESWFESMGCPDALKTILVRTPNEGIHLWFESNISSLFKWISGLHQNSLPENVTIDWLTPTGKQNLTGPGVVREGKRYDLFVPAEDESSELSTIVKPLPTQILRWLVKEHVKAHKNNPQRCFNSSESSSDGIAYNIGYSKALECNEIADLIRIPSRQTHPSTNICNGITPIRGTTPNEAELYMQEEPALAGTRHNRMIEFAGSLISRVTQDSYEATWDMIVKEIQAFASTKCVPAYSPTDPDVIGVIDAARQWAASDKNKIESRIARKTEQKLNAEFGQRTINGATYRCKIKRGNQIGLPICSPTNVIAALEQDHQLSGCFGYDQMNARRSIIKPLPWDANDDELPRFVTDDDMHRIIAYIDDIAGFNPTKDFMSAFATVCARNPFNPMTDFVRSFDGKWDGQEHIQKLISTWLGVDESEDFIEGKSFSGTCLTIWMRGAIRRALHPGCQFDYMLILGGAQGIGKTNFVRQLATRPDWLCENLPDIGDEKKCFEAISASWIACIDELAGMRSQKDVSKVKNYLTRCYDDYRAPYKREQERIKRHTVFVGTTNELSFLSDRSGARRFMVIQCTGVLTPNMTPKFLDPQYNQQFAHEIEQAWAEAYALEKESPAEALVLPAWAMSYQSETNANAAVADPVVERAEVFFQQRRLIGEPVCYAEVYAFVYDCAMSEYPRAQHLKGFQDAVRRVASNQGWKSRLVWGPWGDNHSRIRVRGFVPPAITADEQIQIEEARERMHDYIASAPDDDDDFKTLFA